MLYGNQTDLKERCCPDWIHALILVCALLYVEPGIVFWRWISLILTGFLLLTVAVLGKGRLGGADIKLMAVMAFCLGMQKCIAALLTGSVLALIEEGLLRKNKSGFALIPYLSIGLLAELWVS